MNTSSWQTTVSGIISLVGVILFAIPGPAWLRDIAVYLIGIGGGGVGLLARDNKRTSEDVGAKTASTSGTPHAM
jgi:hypothetical protein